MKIAHIVYSFANGGIETMLVNIANIQVKTNEVVIVVINDIIDNSLVGKLDDRIKCVFIRRKSKIDVHLLKLPFIPFLLKSDIVHFHDLSMIKFFPFKGVNCKWIFTCHNYTKIPRYSYIINKKADHILAISMIVYNTLCEKFDKKKISLCYNGINYTKFLAKTQYNNSVKNIVCVGRFVFKQKGQDMLIQAIKKIVDKGYNDIHFTFWGDGEDLKKAIRMVEELHLTANVTFEGNVDYSRINNDFRNFDLCIQPSRIEGFGLVAAEALGIGVPCILSNIGGHLEIAESGKYALIYNVNDIDSLAEAIIYVQNNYQELNDAIKVNRAAIQNRFSIDNTISILNSVYRN